MPRDPVKNRANTARTRQRRQERKAAVIADVLRYMKRKRVNDDFGNIKGYYVTFDFPDDAIDRFEKLAREHNRTPQQLMHLAIDDLLRGSAKAER